MKAVSRRKLSWLCIFIFSFSNPSSRGFTACGRWRSISGTKTFSYDANGTVRTENANGNVLTFNTDYEDKPLSIVGTTPAGVSVSDTYTYNGLGMRQTGPGLDPLTDGQTPGSPILMNGNITYTPGISRSGGPNGSLFYLTDGHDEVLGQTDSAWTIDDDIRYDPWGNLIKHTGSAPSALTQGWGVDAAYQQDGDTGLTLMGNRYYDPTLGRFLSQDPAGDGDNWYEYCDNDPVGEEDPEGLTPTPTVASMGGGDGDWIGALMGGSGYEGEGGGASFLYLTRWDWDKKAGQYSATWSVPLWGEDDNEYDDAKSLFNSIKGSTLPRIAVTTWAFGHLFYGVAITIKAWETDRYVVNANATMKSSYEQYRFHKKGDGDEINLQDEQNDQFQQNLLNEEQKASIAATGELGYQALKNFWGKY